MTVMNWLISVCLLAYLCAINAQIQGAKDFNGSIDDVYLKYGSSTEARIFGFFDNPRLVTRGDFHFIKADCPDNNYVAMFKVKNFHTMITNRVRIATTNPLQYVSITFVNIKDARRFYASIYFDTTNLIDSHPLDKVIIMHQDQLVHEILTNMTLDIRSIADKNGDKAIQFVIYPAALSVRVPSLIFTTGEFNIRERDLANRIVLSTTIGYFVFYIVLEFFERHPIELFHKAIENYGRSDTTIPDELISPLMISTIIDSRTSAFFTDNHTRHVCKLDALHVNEDGPQRGEKLFTTFDSLRLIENATNYYKIIVDVPEAQHTAVSFKLLNFRTMITNRVQIVTNNPTQIVSMRFADVNDAYELYKTIRLETVNIVEALPLNTVVIMNSYRKGETFSDVVLDIETVADENGDAVDQFFIYSPPPAIRQPFIILTAREFYLYDTDSISRIAFRVKVAYSIFYLGFAISDNDAFEQFNRIIKNYAEKSG